MNNFTTPITEYLQAQHIRYRLLPHQTPATSIEDAARQRGIRPQQMVKSILLRDMGDRYALACLPGDRSVDPRKVREFLQCRRMTCVSADKVELITGYAVGSVTPLLLKTPMTIIFDPSLKDEHEVTIASGNLMAGLALSLQDLVNLCKPEFYSICRS